MQPYGAGSNVPLHSLLYVFYMSNLGLPASERLSIGLAEEDSVAFRSKISGDFLNLIKME